MKNKLEIYTDGGCWGNPGPGGWAYVMITGDGTVIKNSGSDPATTNNKMELTAVISALKSIVARKSELSEIVIHTDSQYVKNGITVWIISWLRNGWKTAAKKPVKNRELWMELKSYTDQLPLSWKWVPGHAGVEFNEMCDALVQEEIQAYR